MGEGDELLADVVADVSSRPSSSSSSPASSLMCPHPGCGRILSRPDRLRNHLKLHSGEKPFSCESPGCTNSYATERALKRHKLAKHPQPSDGSSNLPMAVAPELFTCPHDDCSVTFAHEQSVVRHVRLVHSKPPKFIQCQQCDAKFKKQNKLKEHLFIHTGEKAFPCEFPGCGRSFSKCSLRKIHQKTHDGYRCYECHDLKLNSWSELLAHKKEKHRKEKEKRFPCSEPGCNRWYTRTKYLHQHIQSFHRGERQVCPHCQRKLATAQKLRFHIATYHTGDNPKPLPPPRKASAKPRPKKLTPEEKQRRNHEKLAQQLSGIGRLLRRRRSLLVDGDSVCPATSSSSEATPVITSTVSNEDNSAIVSVGNSSALKDDGDFIVVAAADCSALTSATASSVCHAAESQAVRVVQ